MIDPKQKKIISAIASALTGVVVIVGGFILYFNTPDNWSPFTRGDVSNVSDEARDSTSDSLARQVSAIPVKNYTVDSAGIIRYYQLEDGKVFQTSINGGDPTLLDDTSLSSLESVEWDSINPVVITNVNSQWYTFNYALQQAKSFSNDVRFASFLGNGPVFYLQPKDNLFELIVSDTNLSNPQTILSLVSDQVTLQAIPTTNTLSQTSVASAQQSSPLRIINVDTREATSVLDERYGLTVSWNPNGELGMISYTTQVGGSNLEFTLIDANGFPLQVYPDTNTVAEKIVWSQDSETIYYTKPLVPRNAVMPDDYYQGNVGSFVESLYKLNLTTGENILVSPNIGTVDSTKLQLSPEEDVLLFLNKLDNTIHRVDLPQ